jgi:hypothetical protein
MLVYFWPDDIGYKFNGFTRRDILRVFGGVVVEYPTICPTPTPTPTNTLTPTITPTNTSTPPPTNTPSST